MNRSILGMGHAACLLLVINSFLAVATARADDGDEIGKLWKQVVELQQAGKGHETLSMAQRMLTLAERSFTKKPEILSACIDLVGEAYEDREEFTKAVPFFKRALAVREKALGPDDPDVATSLENLARVAKEQGQLGEAETLLKRALAINEKKSGPDSENYATSAKQLAGIYSGQGRFAEAETLYQQALAIREKALGPEDVDVAFLIHNMAVLYSDMGRNDKAEEFERRALAILEKQLGPDHPSLANVINALGGLAQERGNYAEAERLLRRGLELREKAQGPESTAVAHSCNNLANLFLRAGRYTESKDYYQRSLAIQEKVNGPSHPEVAMVLNNLGSLYVALARLAEAEQFYRRALAIREASFGPEHMETAQTLHNLASCSSGQGRLADAEALYKRALAIREKMLGPDHVEVALTLGNLASTYASQGRTEEAEPLQLRALEIRRRALGDDSLEIASSWEDLSSLYLDLGREAEAEDLARKVLAQYQKVLGSESPRIAEAEAWLAVVHAKRGDFAAAEPLLQRALETSQKTFGPDHPSVAYALRELAEINFKQQRYADAEPLLDRAIQILERTQLRPERQFALYDLRAQVAWHDGRRSEAVADIRRAMDLAEQIRGQTSGAAHERATGFAQYARAFERLLEWQVELGDTTEALAAIERGRARGLLDDMNAAGVDLQAGRPSAERAQLQEQELQLKSRIAQLEEKAKTAPEDKRADLETRTAEARADLYKFYRDQRSTSPVYRTLLSVGATPLRLRQLQRSLADSAGLMLIYFIGEDGGYVLSVRGDAAQVHKLALSDEQAKLLGAEAGPLNQKRAEQVLSGDEKQPGVVAQLANSRETAPPLAGLHALWQVLIPEDMREQLVAGKFERLIVIPDGPLALLPFETLVIEQPGEQAAEAKYLLDLGPPTLYAPSATVLFNLATAQKDTTRKLQEPLFTVADPAYATGGKAKPVASAKPNPNTVATLSAGSSYSRSGGELARLPYTAQEARWLVQGFQKHGKPALMLVGAQATESAIRKNLAGHPILHFACHGLTDQRYGNFFGALAFTPGAQNNPTDDGFLTLPEIYELDLKDCELAILSACQTNYGPQQQGEGVWTLSRGFLVAGARRVVASNWLVDDEAAASLISYFVSGFAGQEKPGDSDYATTLHAAKRWVRKQAKWNSPYYWGTFELIGPE